MLDPTSGPTGQPQEPAPTAPASDVHAAQVPSPPKRGGTALLVLVIIVGLFITAGGVFALYLFVIAPTTATTANARGAYPAFTDSVDGSRPQPPMPEYAQPEYQQPVIPQAQMPAPGLSLRTVSPRHDLQPVPPRPATAVQPEYAEGRYDAPVHSMPVAVVQAPDGNDRFFAASEPVPLMEEQGGAGGVDLSAEAAELQARLERLEQAFTEFKAEAQASSTRFEHAQQSQGAVLASVQKTVGGIQDRLASLNADTLLASLQGYEGRLKKVEQQAKKNNDNIHWISYTRLCAAEKSLRLTRFAKYCGFDQEGSSAPAPTQAAAQPSQPRPAAYSAPRQTPVSAPAARPASSSVPATARSNLVSQAAGWTEQQAGLRNASLAYRNHNPCANADRTWQLVLIAEDQGMVHRVTDGFQHMIGEHSTLPGLGRALSFNASYPQYIQFTNGIVCGATAS